MGKNESSTTAPWPPVVKYLREHIPPIEKMEVNVPYPIIKGKPYGMVIGYAPGMVGWCLCHPNDTFSKMKGRMICYQRASLRVKDWRDRLVRQAIHHGTGQRPTDHVVRYLNWDIFQKTYPRMTDIIVTIERIEQQMAELSKGKSEPE